MGEAASRILRDANQPEMWNTMPDRIAGLEYTRVISALLPFSLDQRYKRGERSLPRFILLFRRILN